MSDEKQFSSYWCWLGSFSKGPQPCGCGGPSDCKDREEHIEKAIKVMNKVDNDTFLKLWLEGKLMEKK